MALIKKTTSKGTHTDVTFKIDGALAPTNADIFLLGDFNNWQMADTDYQMTKKGDSFEKKLRLENGRSYEFRYVNRDFIWFNDEAADNYVPSPFHGVDNCVVELPKAAAPKPAKAKKKKSTGDDLKKIEGIGPKIASILASKGIDTFKKLSTTKTSALEAILKEAGPRYSMHKPGSWPKQAKLADAGNWDALKTLQDKLDGGK
ncbi:MAG: glycoside hydrolase family 13 [Bacteroidota bacterium]